LIKTSAPERKKLLAARKEEGREHRMKTGDFASFAGSPNRPDGLAFAPQRSSVAGAPIG